MQNLLRAFPFNSIKSAAVLLKFLQKFMFLLFSSDLFIANNCVKSVLLQYILASF